MKSLDFTNQTLALYTIIILFAIASQTSANDCVLDLNVSSIWNDSNIKTSNWNGFLSDSFCCTPLVRYIYSLGKRANQTGLIFLNTTEQNACLDTMKSEEKNLSTCGIERLTSGFSGGCSDYSVTDVVNKLGSDLDSLAEDCKLLDSNCGSDDACGSCLRRWEEMGKSSSNNRSNGGMKIEKDACRFAVLVSLTSRRTHDLGWLQSIYNCLGSSDLLLDDQANDEEDDSSHKGRYVLIGGLVGITTVIAFTLLMLCRKSTKGKRGKGVDVRIDSISEESGYQKISLKEVYSATNNLSADNFIGQGIAEMRQDNFPKCIIPKCIIPVRTLIGNNFWVFEYSLAISTGKVYKGILSDGQHIAVKHLINDGHMETFVREVTSLAHVKHPNLVALLGHCDGKDECFLVYELCHNGNLSEWLFGKDKFLNWIQRLEIAIHCATGLWFLHTYPEGCIVHRDIKPTNVLICTNFRAKLSDFGLSKVISIGNSYVSSEVRGTFGYVDPEYQMNRHVNSSTDVYSFGMVLLQILSGQRIINMDLTTPMPLSKMAKHLRKGGHLTEFADPKLNGEYSVDAFRLVFNLALSCTASKQQRPSMEQVVAALENALQISKN